PTPFLRGLAGRPVAVQGAGAIGAGGGGGAVAVEPQLPAPPVDRGQVMEPTRRDQGGQGGGAAAGSGDDVVEVGEAGGAVAAGEGAVRVAGGDRPAQVGGDGFGGGADVQRQAHGRERGAVQGGAQPGGQPAGAGERVGGQGEQRPAQPVAGGRAERLAPPGGRAAGGRAAGGLPPP